jgi:hypothetical protein
VIVCIGLAGQLDPARLEAHFADAVLLFSASVVGLLDEGGPHP